MDSSFPITKIKDFVSVGKVRWGSLGLEERSFFFFLRRRRDIERDRER